MGSSGKSSGQQETKAQLTPEQTDLLKTQTQFLKETAMPAYKNTVAGAQDIYGNVAPNVGSAANAASNLASQISGMQAGQAGSAYQTGLSNLKALFDPQYKEQQVQAALQAGRESARESQASQNAMFGGAGGLGGTRMALADKNLASLNAQRQATAAAAASAGVEANRAAAANQLAGFGQQGLSAAQQAAASRVALAGAPQDIYSKYASVVYGIPQANTTPVFTGTQGSTQTGGSQSKGFG